MFVGPSDATFRPTINRTSKKLTATLDPLPQRQLSEQRKREDRIAQLSEEVEAERRAQETFTPKLTPAPSHMNLHQRIPLSERTNHVVASTLSASTTGGGKSSKHNDVPLKVRAASSAHNGAAPMRSSSLTSSSKTSLSQERGESYRHHHHHHQEGPPMTTEQQNHFHATRNPKSEALVRQGAREHIEELREERKQAQQLWAQYSDGEHSMTRIGALKAFHALRIPDITESTFAKFQSALGIDEESGAFFVGYDRFQKVIQAVLHAVRQSERQKNDNAESTPQPHSVAKVHSHHLEQKQQSDGQSNRSQQRSVFLSTRSHESPSPQQQGRQTQQQATTWEAVSPSPQSRASYFRRSPSSASSPQTMSHEYEDDPFTSSPQPLGRTTSRPMSAGTISSERRSLSKSHSGPTRRTGPQGTSAPSHSARESRTLQQESEKRGVSNRKGSTLSLRHSQAVASASPRAMSAEPLKKQQPKTKEKEETTTRWRSPSATKARSNVSRSRSASTSHPPPHQERIEETPSRPQPQIRSRQSQSETTPANVERLSRPLLSQEARTNLLRLRDELQKKEMEQCTFQPDTATVHQGFVRPTAQIHSNSNQSQQHQQRQRRPVSSRHESTSVEEKNVLRPSRQPQFFQERAAQFGAVISEHNVYESDENQHSDEESTEAYHNPRKQVHLFKESHNQKRSESPQPRHPSHDHGQPSLQPEENNVSPAAATRSVSVTSTVVSSVLGPAPKGFEKAIERMVEGRKRHVPRFEDSLRHHSSSVAHHDDGSEETVAADAASSTTTCAPFQLRTENRTKEREFSKPLLYIDVDLPNGRSGRIGVHRDDKPEVLARNFCLSYGIAQPETIQRLTDVVQEKVDFVNHQHTRTVWM